MNEKITTSKEYIYRCVDIIKADKNISETTIILMFLFYGELLLQESKTQPEQK